MAKKAPRAVDLSEVLGRPLLREMEGSTDVVVPMPPSALDRYAEAGLLDHHPADIPAPWRALDVPRHALTDWLPHIDRMAAAGMVAPDIAARLGLSVKVFADMRNRFADVELALTAGAARGIDEASHALLTAARMGDVSAAKHRLKMGGYGQEAPPAPTVIVNVGNERAPITIESVETMASRQRRLVEESAADPDG